jgi:hypothetical protein
MGPRALFPENSLIYHIYKELIETERRSMLYKKDMVVYIRRGLAGYIGTSRRRMVFLRSD